MREWLGQLGARLERGGGALPEWFEVAPPPAGRGKAKAPAAEPPPQSVAGPAPAGGDPDSVFTAAELLPVWIEELDHAPVAATPKACVGIPWPRSKAAIMRSVWTTPKPSVNPLRRYMRTLWIAKKPANSSTYDRRSGRELAAGRVRRRTVRKMW